MKKIEMKGKVFGKLKVLREDLSSIHKHRKWVCECECGSIKSISGDHLRRGLIVSCGCRNKLKGINGDMWYRIINSNISRRNKRKNLEIKITKDYLNSLFIKQNGRCALSGVKITFPKKWNDKNFTASLDRIDSSRGYVEDNVQWVHKHINIMKNTFPQELFIYMCNRVSENNKIKDYDIGGFVWATNQRSSEIK